MVSVRRASSPREKAESSQMQIITPGEAISLKHSVVTVGTFDGVHTGHADVIHSVLSRAKSIGGTSVVLTFDPHPRQFIDGATASGLLTTLDEKRAKLEALGLDVLAVVPFNASLRQMSPDAFVSHYLVDWLHARHVVVGYDHGFGKDRQGGYETMLALGRHFGFEVTSVAPSIVNGDPISSTRIRTALAENRFDEAVALLGGCFPVWGRVEKGEGRGQKLGFPTANVSIDVTVKLAPPPGVYAGRVQFEKPFSAVINFGRRPTFGDGKAFAFEVHVLDFSGDLYGQTLKVELTHRIRDEQKFETAEALAGQIQEDINFAKRLLSHGCSQ